MRGVLGLLVTLSLLPSAWATSKKINVEEALIMDSIVSIHNKVETMGWEQTIANAKWPSLKKKASFNGTNAQVGDVQGADDPFDDVCVYFPTSAECQQKNFQLRDDGIQILAGEVLYQTLTFFKVKHVFGKLKTGSYGFKVIDAQDNENYQDLQTEQVVLAIKEFRKYVINLLCEDPDPSRTLAMMNRYDVGTRFRWDMAWALLGNKLPSAANKYMRFGPRWQKFSDAIDSIQNNSLSRFPTPEGGMVSVDPSAATAAAGVAKPSIGFIAREVVGIVRLVGDVAAQILQLFCVSDLSVDAKLEQDKQLATYRLLSIKSQLKSRYAPLKAVLDEMSKEATEQAGQPVSYVP